MLFHFFHTIVVGRDGLFFTIVSKVVVVSRGRGSPLHASKKDTVEEAHAHNTKSNKRVTIKIKEEEEEVATKKKGNCVNITICVHSQVLPKFLCCKYEMSSGKECGRSTSCRLFDMSQRWNALLFCSYVPMGCLNVGMLCSFVPTYRWVGVCILVVVAFLESFAVIDTTTLY